MGVMQSCYQVNSSNYKFLCKGRAKCFNCGDRVERVVYSFCHGRHWGALFEMITDEVS